MARTYNLSTIRLLELLSEKESWEIKNLHKQVLPSKPFKDFYNLIFRLENQELVKKDQAGGLEITADGKNLLGRLKPTKDGVWKLVIFDVPEKHLKVRNILRAKLKQLHFKKWQNSIWASPYILPKDIEAEFTELGRKFFVRLVKVSEINIIDDLEKLFN